MTTPPNLTPHGALQKKWSQIGIVAGSESKPTGQYDSKDRFGWWPGGAKAAIHSAIELPKLALVV